VRDTDGDSLLLGQRVVAILETGLRTATYKLATLMALIDHCIENVPASRDDVLEVSIPALAHRVLEIYWLQVRPFEGQVLSQMTGGPKGVIPNAARRLRAAAHVADSRVPLDVAVSRVPHAYETALDEVSVCLAGEPLRRLQRFGGAAESDPFLYDDAILQKPSSSAKRVRGYSIELKPGVAHGLARLAGLLKPALEIMWVDDVRRMNKFLHADVPDVAGHLFGRERAALEKVREPLKEAFGPHCFYRSTHLPTGNPIDHVLPWSLVGIDGLANLVLACTRCNGDKSNALPALPIIDQVLDRDRGVLEQIAADIGWPTQRDRVVAAAVGVYRMQPAGVPTWSGYKQTTRLDIAFPPAWE
jgi:5-methylcytosine-specific restriction endonuclease McrA